MKIFEENTGEYLHDFMVGRALKTTQNCKT